MRPIRRASRLFANLFRRGAVEQRLDQEVRAYVDLLTDEKVAAGLDPREARREALIEFGGAEHVKEEVRDVRAGAWLDQARQDAIYAVRLLRRNPAFTPNDATTMATAVAVLAAVAAAASYLPARRAASMDPTLALRE